jgi:hypothetical protein
MPDRRPAAPWFLLLALGVLAPACAAAPGSKSAESPPPAPAEPAQATASAAPLAPPPPNAEAAAQDLDSAARDFEAALGGKKAPAGRVEDSLKQPKIAAESAGEGAEQESSPCATACRAFASMERAAGHLCSLAGEDDPRCSGARDRLRGAATRLKNACPACEAP